MFKTPCLYLISSIFYSETAFGCNMCSVCQHKFVVLIGVHIGDYSHVEGFK